ncbi:hypothetical protein [Sphingomicrobium astaxanthinifaciens]|uniref:hypothetical protein n=1 Tax=Sphingomicrobium astaxanthinifaciens TaxID=1227949 RepID=UPI001FCCA944|nr:hypothetical protein [Sphingomicrobium astaxanthinifaciens]MCJ7420949.1 hypothetical protein [Sphingomicrobium astaxanthinifaciens]
MQLDAKKRHAILSRECEELQDKIYELQKELRELQRRREIAALNYLGVEVGDEVRLTSKRYKHETFGVVRDANIWAAGTCGVSLGKRPTIFIAQKDGSLMRVSGRMWEPATSD